MKKNIQLIAVLIVAALLAGCYKRQNYILNEGLDPGDILRFQSLSTTSLPADSSSPTVIRLVISPRASSGGDSNTIKLITSSGSFSNGDSVQSIKANSNGIADFVLTSGTMPGAVFLRASILNVIRDTMLTFTKQDPDTLLLTSSSLSVPAGDSVKITAQLKCTSGFPSRNFYCYFNAKDSTGASIGQFTGNFYSNSKGIVEALYYPLGTTYRGKVTIIVTYYKGNVMKQEELELEIVN
jgi:hypothetical protein